MATAFYVADDAPAFMDLAHALIAKAQGRAGATLVNGVLLARFLHASPEVVRRDLDVYCGELRQAVGPYSSTLPRVGHRWV